MMQFQITGGSPNAKISLENQREQDGILYVDVVMQLSEEAVPQPFSIEWKMPIINIYSVWSPSMRDNRHLGANWGKRKTPSRLASWMPVHGWISMDGTNQLMVALSDALTPTAIGGGVCEEDAHLDCCIDFFTTPVAPLKEYRATLRFDSRQVPYYDSVYNVTEWWEKECGYTPAYVPEHARLPMNSLWYSYHQMLDVEDIVKECRLSKPFGMETVIIDDGWQTDDNNRGYAFCGDWEVAAAKVPDMKEFVDRIHETGMKVMLWYSVPFVGLYSKNYERFKDMLLDETGNNRDYWSLDPRYPEVREFLIGLYERALLDWGLDGLKLDFIDSFSLHGKSLEADPRRDYTALDEAVDVLMTDVMKRLTAINPEVLIEFRQSYVGPAIRKYGNMLRVGDCPEDAAANRKGVVNLRLTSGKTAVHSDMLMWNYEEPVEKVALQLASILYSVPQISVKIDRLCESHKKMLAFYLEFWRSHRDVLLDGKVKANHPESAYSLVWAEKDGAAIFTSYTNPMIDCTDYESVIAVNSTGGASLYLQGAIGKSYRVVNCMGEKVESGYIEDAVAVIAVPMAGMVFVE